MTKIPAQTVTLVLHNGDSAQPLQAGHAHKFKAKAGEHYRVLKRQAGEEKLLDNVIAKRRGDDLELNYPDATQVTLAGYYSECRAATACDITLPGQDAAGYKPGGEGAGGAALADGSTLVYAHGAPDALMAMAVGQGGLQNALAGLAGELITYLPSPTHSAAAVLSSLGWLGWLGVAGGAGWAWLAGPGSSPPGPKNCRE
jgi:hypothetical protein